MSPNPTQAAVTVTSPNSVTIVVRHSTPRTATTHYVSEFTLSPKNCSLAEAFSAAVALLASWTKSREHLPDFASREERLGDDSSLPDAWALHQQHREPRRQNDFRRFWHVDIAMRRRESDFDVRVTISHALDYGYVGWAPPAPEPSAPKFIYDWLADERLLLKSGQFAIAKLTPTKPGTPALPLKERIQALNVQPAQADLLSRLIFDPKRVLPVLVIYGEVNPITFPVQPHKLQQLLLGTCYVVWAPPASGWGPAWAAHFPNGFHCRSNTVRLYQPGASKTTPGDSVRHRFFTEDEIFKHGGSNGFVAMIRDGLTRRLSAPKAGRVSSCEDVLALRANADFANQRSKLKSKDEELELYVAEHQRLLEKNQLSDQLLQETDAELQRTKSELDALRPHAEELAAQLGAAKSTTAPAQSEPEVSELLLRFWKNEAKVIDQLNAVALLHSDAIQILPSALSSAEAADQFEHLDQLRDLLLKLAREYRDGLMNPKTSHEAWKIFGRNVFTGKESESLSRDGRAARTFKYNGEDVFMEQHLKIGVKESDARCLRLHFHWDAANKKIVIGHCGKHLPL